MDTDDSLVAFYIADYTQEGYSNEYCDKLLFITVYKRKHLRQFQAVGL